jgi:hypothetical protein
MRYILDRINQFSIFYKYLSSIEDSNITETDIINCIKYNEMLCSPLREDSNPTVGFKYHSGNKGTSNTQTDYNVYGKLMMRDFTVSKPNISKYFYGDCFDLVAYLLNKNPKVPSEFYDIMFHIYHTFTHNKELRFKTIKELDTLITKPKGVITPFNIELREWNKYDKIYWKRYHLDLDFLVSRKVYPVHRAWVDKEIYNKPNYVYSFNDPCYAYSSGVDKVVGIRKIQLYFPQRGRSNRLPRFMTNCETLFGEYKIPSDTSNSAIILTKSNKDRLVWDMMFYKYPYLIANYRLSQLTILALPFEHYMISYDEGYDFMSNFWYRFSNLDYDRVGIPTMGYLKRHWNFIPFIVNKDKRHKEDLSDFLNKHGILKTLNLIKTFLNNGTCQKY